MADAAGCSVYTLLQMTDSYCPRFIMAAGVQGPAVYSVPQGVVTSLSQTGWLRLTDISNLPKSPSL